MVTEDGSELQKQISLFHKCKDMEAEQFARRYDNVCMSMTYPLSVHLSSVHCGNF